MKHSAARPTVTIITPTRNAAITLERCLNSVATQRFGNWEHWIVDSVSTDKTTKIAELAAETDARVKVISEPDKGIYDAMNKAIRLARGEWIYFLGADDELFDADVLSTMLDQAINDCDFLYGNVLLIPNQTLYDGPFDLVKLLSKNICHQAIFYRRDIFERMGGFDLRFPVFADWAFNLKCMLDPTTRSHHVETVVARFQVGGSSSKGKTLDQGWHKERVELLGRRFNLGQADSEILRSVVEELIQQSVASGKTIPWRDRYNNLLRVHNDLINSRGFRIFQALTQPARSALFLLKRKWQ
jgi:glycosyltransferase involved in cell wall biosynthesis